MDPESFRRIDLAAELRIEADIRTVGAVIELADLDLRRLGEHLLQEAHLPPPRMADDQVRFEALLLQFQGALRRRIAAQQVDLGAGRRREQPRRGAPLQLPFQRRTAGKGQAARIIDGGGGPALPRQLARQELETAGSAVVDEQDTRHAVDLMPSAGGMSHG